MIDDNERISRKAHELWEAEGHPHGRDKMHWDAAKEIIALQDSAGAALLPRDSGAETPVEEMSIAIDNEGEAPGLTDTGSHDLTDTAREPAIVAAPVAVAPTTPVAPATPAAPAAPAPARKAAAKRVASPKDLARSEAVATSKAVRRKRT